MEDQVELARRISHSLSDISNQQSRGQSMYVNRKKRSVKWVHEGCGQGKHIRQQTILLLTTIVGQSVINKLHKSRQKRLHVLNIKYISTYKQTYINTYTYSHTFQ